MLMHILHFVSFIFWLIDYSITPHHAMIHLIFRSYYPWAGRRRCALFRWPMTTTVRSDLGTQSMDAVLSFSTRSIDSIVRKMAGVLGGK
jgi:hypothetical protein